MKLYPSSSSPRPFICAPFHWSTKPGLGWMQEGLFWKGNKQASLVLQILTWRKRLHFCIPLCPQGSHIPTPHQTLTVNQAGPPHHQECGISLGTKQVGMPRVINTHSPGLGSPVWPWLCPTCPQSPSLQALSGDSLLPLTRPSPSQPFQRGPLHRGLTPAHRALQLPPPPPEGQSWRRRVPAQLLQP